MALLVLVLAAAACQGPSWWSLGRDEPTVRGVVLVVVDALRADHLDTYGHERSTAPELDRWARDGVVFEQARAAAPWTLPSVASMLTGLYPAHHGAGRILAGDGDGAEDGKALTLGFTAGEMSRLLREDGASLTRLDSSFLTLGEILGEAGFATGAIVNNLFLEPELGFGQGFSAVDAHPATNDSIRRADATVDAALAWLDDHAEAPFFLMVHLMDPHLNYDPPAPVRGAFTEGYGGTLTLPIGDDEGWRSWRAPDGSAGLSDEDREFVVAAYDEEIRFVDSQLHRLLSSLRERGRLSESLVILTADHGEEFWDHGGFEHGHSLYDELLRVPLIVWAPGVEPGRRDQPVSLVDLFPTILEVAGVGPAPAGQDDGVSLWSMLRRGDGGDGSVEPSGRPLFASRTLYGPERQAVIRWPMKGVATMSGEDGDWELYDLADDPYEAVDLGDGRAATSARLRRELEAHREAPVAERTDEALEIDAETLRSLRALGYIDAGGEEEREGSPDGGGT